MLEFPRPVIREVGFALGEVQHGEMPSNARHLKGMPGVMEIRESYNTDTYRAVYVATIGKQVYVLHCFKKKSKSGKATPPKDVNLIKQRHKEALELSKKLEECHA